MDFREFAPPFGLPAEGGLHQTSAALRKGARNLIAKAVEAMESDPDTARGYVTRAARLPFDEHEECHPAAAAALLEVFLAVVDVMQASEGEEWLDAALATLDSADDATRGELRHVLADIAQDYELTGAERRRLKRAIATVPVAPRLDDLPDLDAEELTSRIMAILAAQEFFLEVWQRLTGFEEEMAPPEREASDDY